jgi:CIC family chloride channel protein
VKKILNPAERLFEWLHDKLDKKQFLILASMLVGLTAGLAAVVLKSTVHFLEETFTHDYHIAHQFLFYLILPVIGILLCVFFVQKFQKGKLGRGNSNILYAIAKKSSFLPRDQMYSHVITSALTIGFGGSAGLESPIVTTGAAIGSNFSKTYKVTYKERTLLLACGAAAGIAAAFNAPIAGVLFALEVLLADVSVSAFIPILIAAATGALCSKIILNDGILVTFKLQQAFNYHNVPWYILLGILAGLLSVYYARIFPAVESFFKRRKKMPYMTAIVAGIFLALLIWLFPTLYGEGYSSLKFLADGHPETLMKNSFFSGYSNIPLFVLIFVTAVMLVKVFAAAATIGGGGNGGNFAPSLFVGGYLGFVFSHGMNMTGILDLPVANFTIVAMAGMIAGIMHAPLTGIFLIAEITGGYELMIPLMIVSAFSYSIVRYFEPFSMDTKKLAQKGHIFTHDKDRNILSTLKVRKIIETNFETLTPEMTLGELVKVVAVSSRNIFPVLGTEDELVGILLMDNIREVMFDHSKYDTVKVKQLMRPPAAIVQPDDDMISVMKKFDDTGAWNLPVVENDMYIGFISKSGLLTKYRSQLIRRTAE